MHQEECDSAVELIDASPKVDKNQDSMKGSHLNNEEGRDGDQKGPGGAGEDQIEDDSFARASQPSIKEFV
jgi:hypothetical protein